jgi:hypothetical protein
MIDRNLGGIYKQKIRMSTQPNIVNITLNLICNPFNAVPTLNLFGVDFVAWDSSGA